MSDLIERVTKDSDIDLGIIYHVTDEQILSAFRRGRVAVRRPNPGLEADDAPNALVGVGLTIEDIEAEEDVQKLRIADAMMNEKVKGVYKDER
jgi:hypothetical protein